MKILLVEDDERLAGSLTDALTSASFIVKWERDGDRALHFGLTESFDAIILDLGLPQLDGLTVLRRWRRADRDMPVLILTARSEWEERVEGIEAGADDYVVKPFHVEEVIVRLRALIRRSKGITTAKISFGEFILDTGAMRISRNGTVIELTPHEYRLITFLAHNRGRAVPQEELARHLYELEPNPESNAIEVLVGRIRKRLGSDVIKTRRGFGYMIEGESAAR
jgi:two-component system, OmpR family, response regulator